MKQVILSAAAAVSVFAMSTVPAAAQSASWWSGWWGGWSRPPREETARSAVPEIDASTGLLALAAVGAALLLAWEINRRRKNG